MQFHLITTEEGSDIDALIAPIKNCRTIIASHSDKDRAVSEMLRMKLPTAKLLNSVWLHMWEKDKSKKTIARHVAYVAELIENETANIALVSSDPELLAAIATDFFPQHEAKLQHIKGNYLRVNDSGVTLT
jgi:hypothetical protein